jgi:capsular exopolysaccharide synthesis family protein
MLVVVIASTTAGVVASSRQPDRYTATASLLFRDNGIDEAVFGTPASSSRIDKERDAATNARLVGMPIVAARTIKKLQLRESPEHLLDRLNIEEDGKADLVTIAATDTDARQAAELADTFARVFIELRRDSERQSIRAAENVVEQRLARVPASDRTSPDARSLQRRAEQLALLASLQTGQAELVQPAEIPADRSSPNVPQSAALAFALGLLIAGLAALSREALDRRVRDVGDIGGSEGVPMLASIPEVSKSSTKLAHDGRFAEAFQMLRANLRWLSVDHPFPVILVNSPSVSDGKTTVAWHISRAAALGGARVLLIDADLRRPRIAGITGLSEGSGLAQYLAGQAALDEVLHEVTLDGDDDSAHVVVIPSGATPPNPAMLIESPAMQELLVTARAEYDFVVVDAPPLLTVSDAIPLLRHVDGTLVVVSIGKTNRRRLRVFFATLQQFGHQPLGIVANRVADYGDEYGYTYAYRADADPVRASSRKRVSTGTH